MSKRGKGVCTSESFSLRWTWSIIGVGRSQPRLFSSLPPVQKKSGHTGSSLSQITFTADKWQANFQQSVHQSKSPEWDSSSSLVQGGGVSPPPKSQSYLIQSPFGDSVFAVPHEPRRTSVEAVSPPSLEPSGEPAIKSLLPHNPAQLDAVSRPSPPMQ